MIKEWLDNNPVGVEDGLRHDKWCAMMWPRLKLLHELLADDGVIFICIDDNEYEKLKILLSDIFGEDNHIATFIWETKRAAKGLFVIETKGEFLDGTEDTEYKRQLLDFLTDNFDWDNTVDAGELVFERDGTQLVCKLILTNEYETELPPLIANLAETPPSS